MKKFRGAVELKFQYSEGLGGRLDGAGVTLRLSSYESYEFINAAGWAEDDFGYAVEKGIREGLSESGINPDLGIRIVLESAVYDPAASSEFSFYAAAKAAAIARIVISNSRNQTGSGSRKDDPV